LIEHANAVVVLFARWRWSEREAAECKEEKEACGLRAFQSQQNGSSVIHISHSQGQYRLEMCRNRFFVANPSHFNDFIPISFPFPSEI